MSETKLFLLVGQSNMAGRGVIEPRDWAKDSRILMLTQDLRWVIAQDPVHFDKPGLAGVGLCSEFARVLVKTAPRIVIGLIPCAFGGTSLAEWQPDGKLFGDAVARTQAAQKTGTLTAILWHQGEADAAPAQAQTYAERFAAMMAQLRQQINAPNVPVLVGELCRTRPAYVAFNAVLPDAVRRVPHSVLVTSEDLCDEGDATHFDAASLRTFGKRYAEAFLKIQGDTPADKW